ncbi:hypothetical protein [Vreelandella jeotgali]|nr:hypothetical protein [Halomonas jeotgali]
MADAACGATSPIMKPAQYEYLAQAAAPAEKPALLRDLLFVQA